MIRHVNAPLLWVKRLTHRGRSLTLRLSRSALVLGIAALFALVPARAVTPEEMLKDPALEARARALSLELRCLVCQNQSIDDSNAQIARDLRVLVRERIAAGDSDTQIRHFLVQRYGEFVLLKPPVDLRTAVLWASPLLALLLGAVVIWRMVRRRDEPVEAVAGLSAEERAKLERLAGGG
jgi:cytochrome c-type biogenesis protein CcmH